MARKKIFTEFLEYPVATDNMPVTCDVWNSAHNYHRASLRHHLQASHGWGVVRGLEVRADTKASNILHITPGIAIDCCGNMIVLPQRSSPDSETYTFFCTTWTGLLFVLLRYAHSHPEKRDYNHRYRKEFFVVELLTHEQLHQAEKQHDYVELARIYRPEAKEIRDAVDPTAPQVYEIDLRYRRTLSLIDPTPLVVGLVTEGQQISADWIQGWHNLAREIRQTTGLNVHVEPNAKLDDKTLDVEQNSAGSAAEQNTSATTLSPKSTLYQKYALLVLFEQTKEHQAILTYISEGGTILFDAFGPMQADRFRRFCEGYQIRFQDVITVPELLTARYVFAQPPAGAVKSSSFRYEVGDGRGGGRVILNNYQHAPLWAGGQSVEPYSRATIRDAIEWGANLLTFVQRIRLQS